MYIHRYTSLRIIVLDLIHFACYNVIVGIKVIVSFPEIIKKSGENMAISMLKVKGIMEIKGLKKFDLRKMGFNPNVIDKVLSGTLTPNKRVDTETINRLCEVLNCQPGDIMEYVEEEIHR